MEKIQSQPQCTVISAAIQAFAAQKAFTFGVVNAVDVLTAVQNEFQGAARSAEDPVRLHYQPVPAQSLAGELNEESVKTSMSGLALCLKPACRVAKWRGRMRVAD